MKNNWIKNSDFATGQRALALTPITIATGVPGNLATPLADYWTLRHSLEASTASASLESYVGPIGKFLADQIITTPPSAVRGSGAVYCGAPQGDLELHSTDIISIEQRVPDAPYALSGRMATLSFWVYVKTPGVIRVTLASSWTYEGTTGSSAAVLNTTVNLRAGWSKFSRTFLHPTVPLQKSGVPASYLKSSSLQLRIMALDTTAGTTFSLSTTQSVVVTDVALVEGAAAFSDLGNTDEYVAPGLTTYVTAEGSDATGVRGRSDKPFATIDAALAVALSGDTVKIGPGTFTLPLSTTVLAQIALRGSGRDVTTISASATLNGTGEALILSDGSTLSDLKLVMDGNDTADDGTGDTRQAGLGFATSATASVERVIVESGFAAVHIGASNACTVTFYDTDLVAKTFGIFVDGVLPEPVLVFRGGSITVVGPPNEHSTSDYYRYSACVYVETGKVTLTSYSTNFKANNAVAEATDDEWLVNTEPGAGTSVFKFYGGFLDATNCEESFKVLAGDSVACYGVTGVNVSDVDAPSNVSFGAAYADYLSFGAEATHGPKPGIYAWATPGSAPAAAGVPAGSLLLTGNAAADHCFAVNIGGTWYKVNLTGLLTAL